MRVLGDGLAIRAGAGNLHFLHPSIWIRRNELTSIERGGKLFKIRASHHARSSTRFL
jgi:hypothetical protein